MRTILAALAAVLLFAAGAGADEAPPRTIADIVSLLDQYKPDPVKAEAAKTIASAEPPANAGKRDLMDFHFRRAEARIALGLTSQSIEDRRRALEYARGEAEEPRFSSALASAEMQAGNYRSSLAVYEATLKTPNVRGGQVVVTNYNIARIYSWLGDLQQANRRYAAGEAVFQRIRTAPAVQPFVMFWSGLREWARGDILFAEGKYAEAEAALRRSVAHFDAGIAGVQAQPPGDSSIAVESLYNSIEFVEGRRVQVLVAMGRLAEADLAVRTLFKRILSRVGKYAPTSATTAARFAAVLNEQGRFREAHMMASTAIEIFDKTGVPEQSAGRMVAMKQMADALTGREDWPGALKQLRAIGAAAKGDEVNQRLFRGNPEALLVRVKAGVPAEALPGTQRLLDEYLRNFGPDHYRTGEIRGVRAMALAATGSRAEALREFREATRVLLARSGGDADSTGLALTRLKLNQILESYMTLLFEIRGTDLEKTSGIDTVAEAFRMADALRAGSVQQSLAASAARAAANQPGLGDLIRREQDGRRETATLYETLSRLMALPAEEQLPKVMADMRERIRALEKERRELFAQIEKLFPDYANLISPKPATLDDAKKALRSEEALVSVLSTAERTYVWTVNAQGQTSFHAAALTSKDVARIVATLRGALDPGEVIPARMRRFDLEAAHRLYAELLEPSQGVWGGSKTLYVSASGALAQLPLALLPTRAVALQPADPALLLGEYRAVPWLAKRIAVADIPSVTALARLRALPPASALRSAFVGYGDPQFGSSPPPLQVASTLRGVHVRGLNIPRVTERTDQATQQVAWPVYAQLTPLPDTREEILSIALALGANTRTDVFFGTEANKNNVKKADLSQRRIVAFSTHGLIPGDLPNLTQPALALAALTNPDDSPLLTLDDVLGLKLDADLVVLSACNTAAGDGQGAEAVSGLGRGFFYAGTRALLVTHWPVETVSAKLLVSGVFERYAKDPKITRALALNQSLLAVMDKSGEAGGAKYSYAHPLFWAPYALIGDGGR